MCVCLEMYKMYENVLKCLEMYEMYDNKTNNPNAGFPPLPRHGPKQQVVGCCSNNRTMSRGRGFLLFFKNYFCYKFLFKGAKAQKFDVLIFMENE